MKTIGRGQFNGTTEELQARVAAFTQALDAHALTEGVPAPREADFIEDLARSTEPFEAAPPPPPPPTAAELAAMELAAKRALAVAAIYQAERAAARAAQIAEEDARLALALADPLAPPEVIEYKAAMEATALPVVK